MQNNSALLLTVHFYYKANTHINKPTQIPCFQLSAGGAAVKLSQFCNFFPSLRVGSKKTATAAVEMRFELSCRYKRCPGGGENCILHSTAAAATVNQDARREIQIWQRLSGKKKLLK